MYLTLDDWFVLGGAEDIAEALFNRMEARARAEVDKMTHGRLKDESPVRDAVRYCMFELIQAMNASEALSGGSGRDVASMTNDGVSIAYANPAGSGTASARYSGIVRAWLVSETTSCGVPLLYAGVDA